MHSTGAGNTAPHREQQATGYAGDKPVALFDLDTVGIGAGDIWSTTGDMERWDSALMGQSLLSEESRQTMFAPHARVPPTPPATTAPHYGYGWVIAELQGHKLIFHAGGNAGFVSINAWLPDDDAVVIFLSNDDQIAPQETGMRIASGVLGIRELESGFV
jgi:CubicO group peptidase (beta-lactamase class C family)